MEKIDRKVAYEFLLSKKCGFKNVLIEIIGDNFFNEFRLIGYIKEGMNSDWKERWAITDLGESQMTSYVRFVEVNEKLKLIKEKLEAA